MKFGITEAFPCNYLEHQSERLLICVEPSETLVDHYNILSQYGFRRSGEQIYRPHCLDCKACHSVRIPALLFRPSKSQKRVLSKNRDLNVIISKHNKADYYPLFERYINQLHSDGSMAPPSEQQYDSFIGSSWNQAIFLEAWHYDELEQQQRLIAVAVIDVLTTGLSALYTFFCPLQSKRSLGSYMIMQQIQLAKQQAKEFVYLGYQIDDCRKMNYKTKFHPYERFFDNKWHFYTNK